MGEHKVDIAKCSPVDMRTSLEQVEMMRLGMIGFVPMPVLNQTDRQQLVDQLNQRLGMLLAATGDE